MNELKIFNNPEFGDVRTMMVDDEVWFVGKDVAEALGYSNSSKAVATHVDNEDKQFVMCDIADSQNGNVPIGQSKTAIINESGLYALVFGSKLESANKFKKWVTSEVLPSIRKTGSYQMPVTTTDKIMLLAQGHMELKQEIEEVRSDLETLKMDLPILPVEADRITAAVKQKGTQIMGGKNSNAYRDRSLRHKVYSNMYANLKYNFGIKTYKALKRSQTDKAVEIISAYKPPFILAEEIEGVNAQQTLTL